MRQAVRVLGRSPGHGMLMIALISVTLAGAATVFAVVDGALFKAIPYRTPSELVLVHGTIPGVETSEPMRASGRDFAAWSEAVPEIGFGAARGIQVIGTHSGRPLLAWSVSPDFLGVLGVRPWLGRGFSDDDLDWFRVPSRQRAAPVLLTHALWSTVFGADPVVVSRETTRATFGDREFVFRVVGVLPKDFVFPIRHGEAQPHMLMPLTGVDRTKVTGRDLFVLARLPGVGRKADVEMRLARAADQVGREWPSSSPVTARSGPFREVHLEPLSDYLTSGDRPLLITVVASTLLLVLVALTSLATLALARSYDRQSEVETRVALGATPASLFSLWFREGLLVASAGAAASLVVTPPLLHATVSLLPASMLLLKPIAVDLRTVAVTAVLGAVVAVAISCGPWWAALASVRRRHRGRAVGDRGIRGPGPLVIPMQVALSLVLVTGGVFMLRSLARAQHQPPGFEVQNLLTVAVNVTPDRDPQEALASFADWLRTRHGIAAIAFWDQRLFWSDPIGGSPLMVPQGGQPSAEVRVARVTGGFFEVMEARLVAGRLPAPGEWLPENPVAVISERAARVFWPDGAGLGRILVDGDHPPSGPPREVIGVIADARYRALDFEPSGTVLLPGVERTAQTGGEFLVRTAIEPGVVSRSIDAHVTGDPRLTLAWTGAANDLASRSVSARRLRAWLLGSFGGWSLMTVSTGLFGLLVSRVRRESRRIAISLALGATPHRVVSGLAAELSRSVGLGIVLGIVGAIWLVRAIASYLFDTHASDAVVWSGAVLAVLASTTAAAAWPLMQACQTDPAAMLRDT